MFPDFKVKYGKYLKIRKIFLICNGEKGKEVLLFIDEILVTWLYVLLVR
jgi:hypothetical protein